MNTKEGMKIRKLYLKEYKFLRLLSSGIYRHTSVVGNYKYFGGTCCLYLHCRRITREGIRRYRIIFFLGACPSIPKMEVAGYSEKFGTTHHTTNFRQN
jgi:hypothetical protein